MNEMIGPSSNLLHILPLHHPISLPLLSLHIPNPHLLGPHPLNLLIQQTPPGLRLPRPHGSLGKQHFNLLNRLARRLRIRQKRLDRGAETQDAEDDEEFPGDVFESGRDEEADGEVEEPVRDGGERHACRAGLEGPHFGGVDPGDGGQGDGVDEHEQVAESDDGVGGWAGDLHFDAQISLEAVGQGSPVGA